MVIRSLTLDPNGSTRSSTGPQATFPDGINFQSGGKRVHEGGRITDDRYLVRSGELPWRSLWGCLSQCLVRKVGDECAKRSISTIHDCLSSISSENTAT